MSRPAASLGERASWAALEARTWAALLLLASLLVKLAWIGHNVAVGALRPGFLDWLLLPFAAAHQHVLVALSAFCLYFLVFFAAARAGRAGGLAALAVVLPVQAFLVFYNVFAFRVELMVGFPPTYSFLRPGFEGGVARGALFVPDNLPYTLAGALLVLATVGAGLLARRRLRSWPSRRRSAALAGALAALVALGLPAPSLVAADLRHAQSDPIAYFLADALSLHLERGAGPPPEASSEYRTEPMFGDPAVVPTRELFSGLEAWRRTNRNVILIVLESMPARQASFMGPVEVDGEERDTTPTLRARRDDMLLLESHYATHTTSMGNLFSLGCSLYPSPTRAQISAINPAIPCNSISEVLADLGYATALFHSGSFRFWRKDLFYAGRRFSETFDMRNMPGREGAYSTAWGIDERVTARAISSFIREHRDRPFFLQYVTVMTHVPYDVVGPEFEVFSTSRDLDRYHNCLYYMDRTVSSVLETLREERLDDDTLVVLVADHGEAFHEHPGNREHSMYLYEENVHVAAALLNPLLFQGAPTARRVTSHVDLLPTVIDLVGGEPDPVWEGRSLLEDAPSGPVYFYSVTGADRAGMRDGRFKVVWNRSRDVFEIFDLASDPAERDNLVNELVERVPAYRQALDDWWTYHLALVASLGTEDASLEGAEPLTAARRTAQYEPSRRHPARVDRAVSGKALNVAGVTYRRGFGIHASSWYSFEVGGRGASRLVGRAGRNSAAQAGAVRGYVFLDGELAWDSGRLSETTSAAGFDLDLEGVGTVTLAAWTEGDQGFGDHLDWLGPQLVTDPASAYRPGGEVRLARLLPSGATGPAPSSRGRRAEVGGDLGRPADLRLAASSSRDYDLRVLGAERVLAEVRPEDQGGAEALPEWLEVHLDRRRVLVVERAEMASPVAIDLEVPAVARVLRLRTGPGGGGGLVLRDPRVATSERAFDQGRRRARSTGPAPRRAWELPTLPPAPPLPAEGAVGWASRPAEQDDGAAPQLWLRSGASLRYLLAGLGASRLEGRVRATGEGTCSVRVDLSEGDEPAWTSPELEPGPEGAALEVDLEGARQIVVRVEGAGSCSVVLDELRLGR